MLGFGLRTTTFFRWQWVKDTLTISVRLRSNCYSMKCPYLWLLQLYCKCIHFIVVSCCEIKTEDMSCCPLTFVPMPLPWLLYIFVHFATNRKYSATVIAASWAIVDWSWHQEWNWCVQANLHFKKKKKSAVREWMVKHSPQIPASEEKATTTTLLGLGIFTNVW